MLLQRGKERERERERESTFITRHTKCTERAVVVAQLVERSLPKPEVRSSNPVIGKNLFIY